MQYLGTCDSFESCIVTLLNTTPHLQCSTDIAGKGELHSNIARIAAVAALPQRHGTVCDRKKLRSLIKKSVKCTNCGR